MSQADQFSSRMGPHFPHHAGAAKLNRAKAQIKFQRDGLVRLAGHSQVEHLALVDRQRLEAPNRSRRWAEASRCLESRSMARRTLSISAEPG